MMTTNITQYVSFKKFSLFSIAFFLAIVLLTIPKESHAQTLRTGWTSSQFETLYIGIVVERISNGVCGEACDFYLKPTLNGRTQSNEDTRSQNFYEDSNTIRPHWHFMQEVPLQAQYEMTVRLFEEDWPDKDDLVDISFADKSEHTLTFQLSQCELNGSVGYHDGDWENGMCTIAVMDAGRTGSHRAAIRYKVVAFYETTFTEPTINGVRLDFCAGWGSLCGMQATHEWCQEAVGSHYKWGRAFEWEDQVRPTYVLLDSLICDASYCDSFAEVTCTTFSEPHFHN